jgi:putative ABC transport system substrate-binding protein
VAGTFRCGTDIETAVRPQISHDCRIRVLWRRSSGGHVMRRRDLLMAACVPAVLGVPTWSFAQATRPARIGFIGGSVAALSDPFLSNFQAGLAQYGWQLGQTAVIAPAYANDAMDVVPDLVADLERGGTTVIVTHAQATIAVVRAKRSSPVVYQFSADPVTSGLAGELSRPLFNATGITLMAAELNAKRLDLLREMAPDVRRLAVLYNPLHAGDHLERGWVERRGKELGFDISYYPAGSKFSLDAVLASIAADSPQALLVLSDGFTAQHRGSIVSLANQLAIPSVSGWAVMAEAGALLTFGPRLRESFRRAGYLVDRILRGAKPSDLPIEQPVILELVVNVATARRLGREIPSSLLARADQVID